MALIDGYHHLTMSVDGAQEDYDFFTGTLGMKSVKKTVLFDGTTPVYHLYYGNARGDASTIVTTFGRSVARLSLTFLLPYTRSIVEPLYIVVVYIL